MIRKAIKVKKGSPEAKAKMAALRAMRGKKRTKSTRKTKGGMYLGKVIF